MHELTRLQYKGIFVSQQSSQVSWSINHAISFKVSMSGDISPRSSLFHARNVTRSSHEGIGGKNG